MGIKIKSSWHWGLRPKHKKRKRRVTHRCEGRLKKPVPWWRWMLGLGAYRCPANGTESRYFSVGTGMNRLGETLWYCKRHAPEDNTSPPELPTLDELAEAQGVTPATAESLAAMGNGLPDGAFDGFDEAIDKLRHPERAED